MQANDNDRIWLNVLDLLAYLARIRHVSKKIFFNLNRKLNRLKELTHKSYGPGDSDNIIKPLIFFCDEYIYKNLINSDFSFPKFQEVLLNCSNGGAEFFRLLDQQLLQEANWIVYKLYLLLLRQNFKGQHQDDQYAILDYIIKLEDRLCCTTSAASREGKMNSKLGVIPQAVKFIDNLSWQQSVLIIGALYLAVCVSFYNYFA